MDAVDLMNSDEADLPKTRMGEFGPYLENVFAGYLAMLCEVRPRTFLDNVVLKQLPRVTALAAALLEVVELCRNNKRHAAYDCLDAAIKPIAKHLSLLMPSGDMSLVLNPLYRLRNAGPKPYPRGGLFHIPFQSRRSVGETRYSVAGRPCLYLGGSTEVCWRELRRPNLSAVAVSRFHARPGTDLKVLNFGHRLPLLAAWVDKEPHKFLDFRSDAVKVVAHVTCWPLIAACSIRVPDQARPERPEYFVPQLMLEWIVRTRGFHGIRFFSTHYNEYPDDPKTYMNYVFPARTTQAVGYCPDLCGLFDLTEPVTWEQAKAAPPAGMKRPRYKTREALDDAMEAEYGRAENWLLGLPHGPLDAIPDVMRVEFRDAVRDRAYAIWESEHRTHGFDRDHWFRAKAELNLPVHFVA